VQLGTPIVKTISISWRVYLKPPLLCTQSSWAREQLAALEADAAEEGAAAQYSLNFLYLAKNIAVSVDQVFKAVSLSSCGPPSWSPSHIRHG